MTKITSVKTTDILMFNSQNLGALIVKKDAEVKSWEEQPYSIQNMAIDEEYGFGILNEVQAIACARYIKVRPNEFVMPARTVFNLSESGSTYEDVDGCPGHRRRTAKFVEIPGFSLSIRRAIA